MMSALMAWLAPLIELVDAGGPVVLFLLVVSVLMVAVILFKIWQFERARVGRHRHLEAALQAWDAGDTVSARAALNRSKSYLAPLFNEVPKTIPTADRLAADAEGVFARLERGFRMLDTVAQLAPLLGLFGTVLGMIDAFQALQEAGTQVDPSILAGGIWVALLTTAVGLSVAMPAAFALSWFESRIADDRILADRLIQTLVSTAAAPENAHAAGTSVVSHA